MHSKTILIVAACNDPHARYVQGGLQRLGHTPVLWDWRSFPATDSCSIHIREDKAPALSLHLAGQRYEGPFDAVWVRRRGAPAPTPEGHPDDAEFVTSEAERFLQSALACAGHASTHWVNHPFHDNPLTPKLAQLGAAAELGFRIPPTLAGNHFPDVQAFFDACEGELISKYLRQTRWINSDGSRTVSRTSKLRAEHLADAFPVQACPTIYQRQIAKRFELRITVMGSSAIAAAIDSQRDGPTVDCRREGGRGIRNLRPYALEQELAARCVALCKKLGLSFGAIDLIVGDDGEIYFLEVNPAGQFLWKEAVLPELPLLDTFCRYLADPTYLVSPQAKPLHFKDFA